MQSLKRNMDLKTNIMNKILTEHNVQQMFLHCLYQEGDEEEMQIVTGFPKKAGFNPNRIQECRSEIKAMIGELSIGINSSFGAPIKNLHKNKERKFWTGDNKIVEQLVCLGLATNSVTYTFNPPTKASNIKGTLPYVSTRGL